MSSPLDTGGGRFHWFKKKGLGRSSSFQSRENSAGHLLLPAPPSSVSMASSYIDPRLHALQIINPLLAVTPPISASAEPTLDADLRSNVRLILHAELKQMIEMARHSLLPRIADGQLVANPLAQVPGSIVDLKLLEINDLEMQLRESKQKQLMLQEEVEMLKRAGSEFNSGSFSEDGPSPPMLQDAHNAMRIALLTCAAKVNERVTTLAGIRSKKSTFIRQLCNCFFHNFETASFGRNPQVSTFQRPDKDQKCRLFKEYKRYMPVDGSVLFKTEMLFQSFFNSRCDTLIHSQTNSTPFPSPEQRKSVLAQLLQPDIGPLYGDFVWLAKTVWLLHKLAFAFEPTAEIFRVNEGCYYDSEYMEVPDADIESLKKSGGADIGFMAAPGFTLTNFIIKAQVHLKGKET